MWLREEYGSHAFFPDTTNTRFDLPADVSRSAMSLVVEGSAVQGSSRAGGIHVATPGTTPGYSGGGNYTTPGSSGPGGTYTTPGYRPFSKKGQTINVKVIQATMKRLPNGKYEFAHIGQTFVDVTESTANTNYVRNVVQKKWGSQYTIVSADGLEIDDSSGTQGLLNVHALGVHCACTSCMVD